MVSLLVVDDEPMVVQTLQMQLSPLTSEGVWIEGALSSQEALELIPKLPAPLAVVIADYLMPGLKGDDLLIEIHRIAPQAKLILLTGQAEAHNVGKIVNHAPLYRYIAKPWDPTDLLLTVREALRTYHLERAYETLSQTLEERLTTQNQALLAAASDPYLRNLSHDLKGPLSGLKQLATLLKENPKPPEKVQKYATLLTNSLSELESYVQNLLDIAKHQRNGYLQKQAFSWKELAGQIAAMLLPQASTKGIQLELLVPDSQGWGDPIYLKQALLNLLTNAIKFTPPEKKVTFQVQSTDIQDIIWIKDEGMGMDAETLRSLWEPSQRPIRTGTAGETGTGIGLPLVKTILESHDGQIQVSSQVGQGTTFQITLPRKP